MPLPLSRFWREREGPAKREREGLYTGLGKTLTSPRCAVCPSSPAKSGRRVGSGPVVLWIVLISNPFSR
jgi:hypothetical protein